MNSHTRWMAQTPDIGKLRIDELILPGTHNSGMDKQSPNFSWLQEVTQDVSPLEQIRHGIRVLDLRVSLYEEHGATDPSRFQLYHATSSGRTIGVDILGALEEFYQNADNIREIIILDFHQFDRFDDAGHAQLCKLIIEKIGARLISFDLGKLTLEELWRQYPGKNVVIAYNHGSALAEFWDGVNQRWSGSNLNTTATLKAFMDKVAEEKKDDHELRSIQCAKYVLPLHVPDDFSDTIDEWFFSESAESYIQNFYIINTDWALRSDIVGNCIHANTVRARSR